MLQYSPLCFPGYYNAAELNIAVSFNAYTLREQDLSFNIDNLR